ncbi:MAG: hypothetical protein QF736_04080 [Candidatus Thalassarchaeaceae archaeon]|nr:hypothetical protein [Candidatus Thalassarchaeaceae archaeon]
MSDEWQLRRCVCGHSFGCNIDNSPSCTKCGSSNSKSISIFDDPRKLATAVSNANMPREIADDISKRIQSLEQKSALYNATNVGNNRSRAMRAMRDATDDSGILTIESLEAELAKMEIYETTSHHLIGQAEVEGILLRNDSESWSWLQQSS